MSKINTKEVLPNSPSATLSKGICETENFAVAWQLVFFSFKTQAEAEAFAAGIRMGMVDDFRELDVPPADRSIEQIMKCRGISIVVKMRHMLAKHKVPFRRNAPEVINRAEMRNRADVEEVKRFEKLLTKLDREDAETIPADF